MKKLNITVIVFAGAAFVFLRRPECRRHLGSTLLRRSKRSVKQPVPQETKIMNKTDKTPKAKTMPNGADKAKGKAGATKGLKIDDEHS